MDLDMGFALVRFACYAKGEYAVAVQELGPVSRPGEA